jgi:ABC-2 type transport system permease protein
MRTIKFLLQKEFKQIFRNKIILAMILVMPAVQLMILPLAADYEIKNINIAVIDHDQSPYSQRLITTITASGYFRLTGINSSYDEAFELIEQDEADLLLEIPAAFEKRLIRENAAYLATILKMYNNDLRLELVPSSNSIGNQPVIEVASSNWFNVLMNYRVFMVPGILAILVTMIGGFLSALNIVKEKEVGTIEQINVTPIRKHHFILGKLIPFWVLGNIVFTIGLLISWLIYGIVPLGSLFVLYGFVAVYLLSVLGLGLLVSTICDTQQQAMFIMFFFMMIFILLGGLFTSTDSMPEWARFVSKLNPVSYLIDVMRMVILKGSGFGDVWRHLIIVGMFAVALNGWAVLNYKKTS